MTHWQHKKEKSAEKAKGEETRAKHKQAIADKAQAALEARQFSKRCCTCDRTFMRKRFLDAHSLICKGNPITKAMKEEHFRSTEEFHSLKGRAVSISVATEFPVPQFHSYQFNQWFYKHLGVGYYKD